MARALRGRTKLLMVLSLVALLSMVLAACGDDADEPDDTADADEPDQDDDDDGDDAEEDPEPEEDSDVLEPNALGFPDQPITFWNRADPGHPDDLYNIAVTRAVQHLSPVPLQTDSHLAGPRIVYDLMDFLRTQPGWEDGYHVFGQSFTGPTTRPLTNEASCRAGDHYTDFVPIGGMITGPMVIGTPLDGDFETIDEFVEWAQEQGSVRGVGGGLGSTGFLVAQLFTEAIGVELNWVVAEGGPESLRVLQGGGSDFIAHTFSTAIKEELTPLAVTTPSRTSFLPDVPTTDELGWDVPIFTVRGVATFPEVPAETRAWIGELIQHAMDDEQFQADNEGFIIEWMDEEETRQYQENYWNTVEQMLEELPDLKPDC